MDSAWPIVAAMSLIKDVLPELGKPTNRIGLCPSNEPAIRRKFLMVVEVFTTDVEAGGVSFNLGIKTPQISAVFVVKYSCVLSTNASDSDSTLEDLAF